MSSDEKPELLRIAESISDGVPVDWEARSATVHLDEPLAHQLRDIEKIVAAHREGGPASDARSTGDGASEVAASALPAAAAEPALGTWGHLRILEKLGEGVFGEVFRAYDPSLQREVALKLLHPRVRPLASEERDLDEARRIARVRHPNILVVHGAERHDGRVGLWTDLVRGGTLEEALARQGPFGAHEAAVIGMELCRALAAVHGAGLVHRDLKAANVMREQGGRVVLTDLGAASEPTSGAVAAAAQQGTPATMAPERLLGGAVGPAADIYGLGVLLFHLATGRYPIEAESLVDLCDRHRRGETLRLLDLRPDLPAEFVRVVERALAPRPERRFSSAGEMESALAATLGGAVESGAPRALPAARGRGIRWWLLAAAAVAIPALILLAPWKRFPSRVARQSASPGGSAADPRVPTPAAAPTARLHRLRPGSDEPLSPNSELALGDALSLEFEGPEPMHVYVFDRDEKGSVFVLFPIAGLDLGNPLPAHAELRLPGTRQGKPFDWRVSSRGGGEEFIVLASRTPLDDLEKEIASLPSARVGGAGETRPGGEAASALRGVGALTPEPASADSNGRRLSESLGRLQQSRPDVWVWKLALRGPEP
jgi:eukaryotic-like serine/threonine-protein kinase